MKKKIIILMGCLCIIGNELPSYAQADLKIHDIRTAQEEELPDLIIEKTGTGEQAGEQYDSVLQVILTYTTESGETIPIQGGSGFLVGGDDTQMQYLITTGSVAVVPDQLKEKIRKKYRLEKKDDVKEEIKVVISKDVTLDASIVAASEEMDFALLQLSQPLHDRQALLLNDKPAEDYLRQPVSVIGYPAAAEYGQEMVYYTDTELLKSDGFLEMEQIRNGQKYIQHHIFPNYGNIGGPIVDSNGAVVALNQTGNDGKNFYALEITEITHVMDSLGIPYRTVSQMEAEEAAAQAAIVHKEALNSAIEKAKSLELSQYKKKTTQGFEECIDNAKKVQENASATQGEVDEQVQMLEEAMDALVPKMPLKIKLGIIGACCLVVLLTVLIVLKKTSASRKARKERRMADFTVTEPAPVFGQDSPVRETSYKDVVQAGNSQVSNRNIWNMTQATDDEETTVLGAAQDDAPTGVLRQQPVTLIRCSNNENILIHKFPFIIGKDKGNTDYWVQNNTAVSRVHAVLLYENNTYQIQDNNATNGTFVNGKRLPSGGSEALQNNDRISLGNEEFEFRMTSLS